MIEADNLSKFYGDFAACRDVTFTINRGEVAAFLGPERRRQEHDHEAADRLSGAVDRQCAGSPGTTWRPSGSKARSTWATCRKTDRCIPT